MTNQQRGGSCSTCSLGLPMMGGRRKYRQHKMRGGATTNLSPASLTGDSFDRSGPSLANAAHNMYIKNHADMINLKNQNVMLGGRRKYRTAKRCQRGGILGLGALIEQAAVPMTLLAAQQRYKKKGSSRSKSYRKSRKFGNSRRK